MTAGNTMVSIMLMWLPMKTTGPGSLSRFSTPEISTVTPDRSRLSSTSRLLSTQFWSL